jgi:hypothetical protein
VRRWRAWRSAASRRRPTRSRTRRRCSPGLDKITGRIIAFEVAVDETVQFGALQMTPRVCYTRPPTESPQTTTFVEVDEVTLENSTAHLYGWMFAASPGLHGIEHPVYDIWGHRLQRRHEVIAEPKGPDDTPVAATRENAAGASASRGPAAARSRLARRLAA